VKPAPAGPLGWRLLAGAAILALTVPRMWQRGMFLDGVVYAAIARNLALGEGSFWAPFYTATVFPAFFEHPPLGFALQGVAFGLFGDHAFVERGYSVFVLLLHGLVIGAIWRRLLPAGYDWLPVLFWVIPSIVTWAAINNMLENTQALLTSSAVYLLLRAGAADRPRLAVAWGAGGGLAVAAATLVKGPVGLFPLAVPALGWLLPADRRPRQWWALTTGLFGVIAIGAAVLALAEGPRLSMVTYLSRQVLPAVDSSRGDGPSIADVSRHLTVGITGRLAVLVGFLWLIRRRRPGQTAIDRSAWYFLATGLAASLPLLLSERLSGHYFLPSVPFFALAAAAVGLPAVLSFRRETPGRMAPRVPLGLAAGLLAAAGTVIAVHGTLEPRNRDLIASFDALQGVVPVGRTVGSCAGSSEDWGLVAYAQRLHRLSLTFEDRAVDGWFLRKDEACGPPPACQLAAGTPPVELYRCEPPTAAEGATSR
jgi:hypothetical protein